MSAKEFRLWLLALVLLGLGQLVFWSVGNIARYHLGYLVTLISLGAPIFGLAIVVTALIRAFPTRGRSLLIAIAAIGVYFGASFAAVPLAALADRVVLAARKPLYERAIRQLEAGVEPSEACADFRRVCGVSRGETLRVAFYHSEFYDKYIGIVYDPSGYYGTIKEFPYDPAVREELYGELVPGIVGYCREIEVPYYRCFFS